MKDLEWYIANRENLAREHAGRWLVVHEGNLVQVLAKEEDALAFAVENFGIDSASVFHATAKDPYVYIG